MSEKIINAIYGAADKPLKIGNVEIPCYVLEDDRRVLVQGGMIEALGISHGGSGGKGGDRLAKFTHQDRLKAFLDNEILERTDTPIYFRTTSGTLAYGYDAEVLAKICFGVLDAAKEGKLQRQQEHIVKQCEILVRGFAIVGINALVDEATGYQQVRSRLALQAILDRFLRKELAAWAKRFPDEFYEEMFRLKNWQWRGMKVNRPSIVGKYTNDLVYERLAPELLIELEKLNPKGEKGSRKAKHHQWLTEDVGHPVLAQHLYAIIGFMRAASTWEQFHRMVERAFPKRNSQMLLPGGDKPEPEEN
jgi:P63C domain